MGSKVSKEVREIREIINEKDETLRKKKLAAKTRGWMEEKLLCGVIGNTGTGKSSLINAIRNLTPMNEGAAPVNVVESTAKPTPYPDPNNKNLIYYDLPGVGTKNYPRKSYLKDIDFKKYDFFFLVTSSRFTENDIWFTEEIRARGKRFYFIRTKIDQDIRNEEEDCKHDETTILREIREHTVRCLENEGFGNSKVYLLSNRHRELYDFSQLVEDVIKDLPHHKQEAMALSVHVFSETLINEKKKSLKKYVYLLSAASAGIAAAPVPGLSFGADFLIIMSEIEHYRRVFGLMDNDLERCGIPDERLNIIKLLFTKESVLKLFSYYGFLLTAEETSRLVFPIVGSIVGSALSLYTTYNMLNDILEKMADHSLEVLTYQLQSDLKKTIS